MLVDCEIEMLFEEALSQYFQFCRQINCNYIASPEISCCWNYVVTEVDQCVVWLRLLTCHFEINENRIHTDYVHLLRNSCAYDISLLILLLLKKTLLHYKSST